MIEEDTTTPVLEERNTPSVGMVICSTATLLKSRERKADVGRDVAVHAEKLAHSERRRCLVKVDQ
jgi:hypothetical protein